MANRMLWAFVALLAGGVAVLAIQPGLDLRFSEIFGSARGFPDERIAFLNILRIAAYRFPYVALGLGLVGLAFARFVRKRPRPALFLCATLILGPGLLINVGLKDHSHRPRPVQVLSFGGAQTFKPWYRFDGACRRNCSFASGEAAAAFWTAAPALLTPPPFTLPSVAAALAFGLAASALRLAFGGHFLSDVLFAGLTTLVIVLVTARLLRVGPDRSR